MPSAVLFDASGEFYTRSVTNPGGYSLVMWIKRSSDQGHGPFAYGLANAAGATVFITRSGGQLKLLDLGSTSIGGLSMSDDTWYCIGLTVSATGDANYYYGSDPGSLTTASASGVQNPTGTQTFFIGVDSFDGDWWRGSIAAVKIWTGTVLDAGQIEAELGQYEPIATSGLFGYYPFDTGPSTTDASGNGHDLTGGSGASEDASGPSIPLSGGVEGALAGTTPAPSGTLTGVVIDSGVLAGTTAAPSGALVATLTDSGVLAGTTPAPTGSLAATVIVAGVLAGLTTAPSGSLVDTVPTVYPLHVGTVVDGVTRSTPGTVTDLVARLHAGTAT